jgi:hypothetical protein
VEFFWVKRISDHFHGSPQATDRKLNLKTFFKITLQIKNRLYIIASMTNSIIYLILNCQNVRFFCLVMINNNVMNTFKHLTFFFQTGFYYVVAQAGLKLMTLLPQLSKSWDYSLVPSCLAQAYNFILYYFLRINSYIWNLFIKYDKQAFRHLILSLNNYNSFE